jgi:hypothetical protein
MKATTCAVALFVLVAMSVSVRAAESLAAARELYASAAYADALVMLNGLASSATTSEERQSIDLYRTLCLVAVGRTSDADRAIEAMIQRDPLYRPSAEDLSPRLRSAFDEVRKRLLPSIIQNEYAEAKAAFDRKDFPAAAAGFDGVLRGIADPGISAIAAAPPLSDLRMLATGFKDLSVKFTPPPPAPAPEPAKARPVVKSVYAAEDAGVVPPVAIEQKVPKFPATVTRSISGVIELVIDETGAVQSEMMRMPIDSAYDKMLLSAAAKWHYRPAMLNGAPVKFLKRLSISVSPTAP